MKKILYLGNTLNQGTARGKGPLYDYEVGVNVHLLGPAEIERVVFFVLL